MARSRTLKIAGEATPTTSSRKRKSATPPPDLSPEEKRRQIKEGKKKLQESAPSKKSKRLSEKHSRESDSTVTEEEHDSDVEATEVTEVVVEETTVFKPKIHVRANKPVKKKVEEDDDESIPCSFIGQPIPIKEAKSRWPHRYPEKPVKKLNKEDEPLYAVRHYQKAEVEGMQFDLDDAAYVKGEDDKPDYIGRIIELFEGDDDELHFTCQWYFRHIDTAIGEGDIKELDGLFDGKRLFFSDNTDVNYLECLVKKLKIVHVKPDTPADEIPECDFYCDMKYYIKNATIAKFPEVVESVSAHSSEGCCSSEATKEGVGMKSSSAQKVQRSQLKLLDLYAGCGGMSTGLCQGAAIAGIDLTTSWAVDLNANACDSLRFNHPETRVHNVSADDFLLLIKSWGQLCTEYLHSQSETKVEDEDTGEKNEGATDPEEFEVEKLLDICYGDPKENGESELHFKVQWKGYGPEEDTWEPYEGIRECTDKLKEFVAEGHQLNILPLPGTVDVVCGGPPCQGVSGFNRFRNVNAPLEDERNSQLKVFMDIIEYLKPKYVLMENVTDILKFKNGYLGRYAIGRLVALKYQTRVGLLAAGPFGLPQFRMRAFFWGALHNETLPQFPLPTHQVIGRPSNPTNFENCVVAHDEDCNRNLGAALTLWDAISDLPPVNNGEKNEERPYESGAATVFQRQIRLLPHQLVGMQTHKAKSSNPAMLFNHIPLNLNDDDFARVCYIPKEKGANFRNMPGVLVDGTNKVYFDETMDRVLLPSGNPLVPDYAMKFVKGKSKKPFGRVWEDEIITTVVTRAEPHNQKVIHPHQDRVLSVRENARLQGFPDYYKLFGTNKEKYIQVGNAVAVPVARALGYALGLAVLGFSDTKPSLSLPPGFPYESLVNGNGV